MDKFSPFRIGCLIIDQFALLSFSAFIEPLRAANTLANKRLYALTFLSSSGEAVSSSYGISVEKTHRINSSQHFDMITVIAGGDPSKFDDRVTLQWLKYQANNNSLIAGISGGPFIMARSGIMNEHRMTVHWEHAEALRELHPNILLERSLYVKDRKRITCAGGTAPLDMVHDLIVTHHGNEFAQKINDWFIHTDIRPAYGAQRASPTSRYRTTNSTVISAISIMENNISKPVSLDNIATNIGISPRNLNRVFHNEMGKSTMSFYRILRLEKANNLLQHAAVSITDIAFATGFSSSAHFATAYRKFYGRAPSKTKNTAGYEA